MQQRKADSTLLENAIRNATSPRLVETLWEICQGSVEAFNLACDKLLVGDEDEEEQDESTKNGTATEEAEEIDSAAVLQRKRVLTRSRYEVCKQCHQEYDVEENGPDSCVFHDGDTEPDFDGDFWADHDEDCHGVIDTDYMRKEFPEGFLWNCCRKMADQPGCQCAPHRPASKRARR